MAGAPAPSSVAGAAWLRPGDWSSSRKRLHGSAAMVLPIGGRSAHRQRPHHRRCRSPATDPELLIHVLEMLLHGSGRNPQLTGDLGVRLPLTNQKDDLPLTKRQSRVIVRSVFPGSWMAGQSPVEPGPRFTRLEVGPKQFEDVPVTLREVPFLAGLAEEQW